MFWRLLAPRKPEEEGKACSCGSFRQGCGGENMRDPALTEYDDRQAAVCLALGIAPKAWQVSGRMRDGRFFSSVVSTEKGCQSFVAAYLVGQDDETRAHSHLICAQYPELSDAWALEAMRVAMRRGLDVSLRCRAAVDPGRGWLAGVSIGRAFLGQQMGDTPGEAVRDALYFTMRLHRAAR